MSPQSPYAKLRTQALKHILEGVVDNPIVNIKEDLIEETSNVDKPDAKIRAVTFGQEKAPKESSSSKELSRAIAIFHCLIGKELVKAANLLEIDELELKAWIDLQIEVPAKTILHLLRVMQSLRLDPLNEEIGFTQYEDGAWQVFITIEGCSKLLNNHSQFNGLAFTQSETLVEGVPEWIEC